MQKPIPIVIPPNIAFADLKLSRNALTGDVAFDWRPIDLICAASGIDPSQLRQQDEGYVAEILSFWYAHHKAAGGELDAAMEDLIGEVREEDAHGFGFSHQPGRA